MNINDVKKNFETVVKNVDGRALIVAATKTVPKFITDKLSAIGITDVGENRVQEFRDKYDTNVGLNWHFIGQLQTNKVKYIYGKTVLIHSLDREELAAELQKHANRDGSTVDALIEVNIGDEINKGGINKKDLFDFVSLIKKYDSVKIKGIMSVPPHVESLEELKGYYGELASLYEKLKAREPEVKYLSVGMSEDYELALEYGANIVRIGRGIFGGRSIEWEDLPIG